MADAARGQFTGHVGENQELGGIYVPYSLRTALWVLLRPTRIRAVNDL